MREPDEAKNDSAPAEQESHVGDTETAGETTAAATISGPPDMRPVGADTLVEVAEGTDAAAER